ncbi:MarR family winged helix-turn-helix transcriptional regulator [Catenuloplanes indicus]|uniref:DNA-binding MarR family transcriptional regulator n=1 Tax=Catenuloplanes indicus TaxID=137267 RepID=A0AAE3W0D8_9ACTN|nr:MarR family transcriptional regulator [Catenuloplanes indicus]MDQ0367328.1 DNA-binding MarR family transcriptional regulator [Catenuloplanes indicus]
MAERTTALQLALGLREAITRLNRRLRQARPVGDLTMAQLSALTSLELAGSLSPRELADVERVQPPTMTKIIAKLEERGMVLREPHPTDGRQVILRTTAQGRQEYEQVQRAHNEWLADHLADLSAEDLETLHRAAEIMRRVARAA